MYSPSEADKATESCRKKKVRMFFLFPLFCFPCRMSHHDATMTHEVRRRQTLRQRVAHHMMRVEWNQFNYTAQSQLAEVVFPNIDVSRILVTTHRVDTHNNVR